MWVLQKRKYFTPKCRKPYKCHNSYPNVIKLGIDIGIAGLLIQLKFELQKRKYFHLNFYIATKLVKVRIQLKYEPYGAKYGQFLLKILLIFCQKIDLVTMKKSI